MDAVLRICNARANDRIWSSFLERLKLWWLVLYLKNESRVWFISSLVAPTVGVFLNEKGRSLMGVTDMGGDVHSDNK